MILFPQKFSYWIIVVWISEEGNLLVSRSILISYLVACLGGAFMIEQPASSRLCWYPKFEELLRKLRIWRVGWWSRHYGALSPTLTCNHFSLWMNAIVGGKNPSSSAGFCPSTIAFMLFT